MPRNQSENVPQWLADYHAAWLQVESEAKELEIDLYQKHQGYNLRTQLGEPWRLMIIDRNSEPVLDAGLDHADTWGGILDKVKDAYGTQSK